MSKDANGNPLIVDSDAHVVECDRTWDYLEASERQFRPVPLASPEENGASLQFWLVDGKVRGFRFPAFSEEELARRQQQVGRRGSRRPRRPGSWATWGYGWSTWTTPAWTCRCCTTPCSSSR